MLTINFWMGKLRLPGCVCQAVFVRSYGSAWNCLDLNIQLGLQQTGLIEYRTLKGTLLDQRCVKELQTNLVEAVLA